MGKAERLAIIGTGNIGAAIAEGMVESGRLAPGDVVLSRRRADLLEPFGKRGYRIAAGNREAVRESDIVIVAVEPQQVDGVLREIAGELRPKAQVLISVVSAVSVAQIRALVGKEVPVVRAMPNTAIAIHESMTCLATDGSGTQAIDVARSLFDSVGKTLVIEEEQMVAATALAACGIAFFLRAIRAASQGGIETGLHTQDSLLMAAQTARGAASLLLSRRQHPEQEIDRVTTPRGCTIAGLNQMEHEGFSSAMIRGIVTSAEKAGGLYRRDGSG